MEGFLIKTFRRTHKERNTKNNNLKACIAVRQAEGQRYAWFNLTAMGFSPRTHLNKKGWGLEFVVALHFFTYTDSDASAYC